MISSEISPALRRRTISARWASITAADRLLVLA